MDERANVEEKAKLRKERMDIATEGVKALLAVNGAAAAAMLAFLQAQWGKNQAPLSGVLLALAFFAVGMALGASVNFVRVESSLAHEHDRPYARPLALLHRVFAWLSVAAFVAGCVAVVLSFAPALICPRAA